jgi:hypothetical protein
LGTLYFGSTRTPLHLGDRLLAHLEIVITSKLRRGEGLLLSWVQPAEATHRRGTCWITSATELLYLYESADALAIDRDELERLSVESNSSRGIQLGGATLGDALTSSG